jgi:hypothetical protein
MSRPWIAAYPFNSYIERLIDNFAHLCDEGSRKTESVAYTVSRDVQWKNRSWKISRDCPFRKGKFWGLREKCQISADLTSSREKCHHAFFTRGIGYFSHEAGQG